MSRKLRWFFGVLVAALALDQGTKGLVYNLMAPHAEIKVIPGFFSIVHAQNPAAAMGLLGDNENRYYVFAAFTIFAVIIVVELLRRLPSRDAFTAGILGLIISGTFGNAIDRIHKRTVTDFLRFYTEIPSLMSWLIERFGTNEWPSFNIADSTLVVGVLVFLAHYLFAEEESSEAPNDGAPGSAGTPPPESP